MVKVETGQEYAGGIWLCSKKLLSLQQSWQELSEHGAASGKKALEGGQRCWRMMFTFIFCTCDSVLSNNRSNPVEFLWSSFDICFFAVLVDAAILECHYTLEDCNTNAEELGLKWWSSVGCQYPESLE